jgi:hypothetical protein
MLEDMRAWFRTITRSAAVVGCLFSHNACGDAQPTRPSKTVPSATGTWSGTYHVTGCHADFDILPCGYFVDNYVASKTTSMRLIIAQTGNGLTGLFTSDLTTGPTGEPVPVSGSIDSLGTLRLQGSRPFKPGCLDAKVAQGGIDIGDWTTVIDDTGTSLTGTFRQSLTSYFFSCYVNTIDFQSEIVTLTMQLR